MMNDSIHENPHMDIPHDAHENVFSLAFPKNDDSFPVLKAFQEFIDAERERARKRQTNLTICFVSTILFLIILFVSTGIFLFQGMMERNDLQQKQIFEFLMERAGQKPPAATAPTSTQTTPLTAAPVAPQPDPQVSELLAVIKSLQAQNAEMMSALQARLKEAEPAPAPAPVAATPAPKPTPKPAPKTGVITQIKPKPAPVAATPAPTPKPAPTPVAATPAPAPKPAPTPVAATPAPAPTSAVGTPDPDPDPVSDSQKPIEITVRQSREMRTPKGYSSEQMPVVSTGNVKIPWRVLMPGQSK